MVNAYVAVAALCKVHIFVKSGVTANFNGSGQKALKNVANKTQNIKFWSQKFEILLRN